MKGVWKPREKTGLDEKTGLPLALPVLLAIAERPRSPKELVHLLLISRDTLHRRIVEAKEAGVIDQFRTPGDWKFYLTKHTTPLSPTEEAEAIAWLMAQKYVGGPGRREDGSVPESVLEKVRARLPGPCLVASTLGVPAFLVGAGFVHAGYVTACEVCGGLTALRFGDRVVCKRCPVEWQRLNPYSID